MRFRATMAPEQVAHFYALMAPLAKLPQTSASYSSLRSTAGAAWQKTCLLSLDNELLQVSVDLPAADGMTCVAAVQARGGLFLEHRIESNAGPDNRIVMRVDLTQLRTALQSIQQQVQASSRSRKTSSSQNASSFLAAAPTMLTVLKLAKRDGRPCLCLQAKTAHWRMEIHQSIPVQIQRPTEWIGLPLSLTSSSAPPTVQLLLPPAASAILKTLVDQLLATSSSQNAARVSLTGHAATAELSVGLEGDALGGAQVQTLLLGRAVAADVSRDHPQVATALVDARKVAAALAHGAWTTEWSWLGDDDGSADVQQQQQQAALVVTVRLEPIGVCTYLLPVHYVADEDTHGLT
jgi:hypothetical protein